MQAGCARYQRALVVGLCTGVVGVRARFGGVGLVVVRLRVGQADLVLGERGVGLLLSDETGQQGLNLGGLLPVEVGLRLKLLDLGGRLGLLRVGGRLGLRRQR